MQTTAASTDVAAVRLERIGKRYGAGAPVLSGIDWALKAGEFRVLTGAAGAGKTTLLRIVSLAEPPSSGRLILFGSDTAGLDRAARAALRRRIGIVFEDARIIDDWTVADNVALPLRIAGAARREIARNVPELLAWVGLDKRIDAPGSILPGSERQLVAIARALVGRPELLVADEPAANLDADSVLQLARIFRNMNRLGTTVLVATRDTAFARHLGEPAFHLEDGRLSADRVAV